MIKVLLCFPAAFMKPGIGFTCRCSLHYASCLLAHPCNLALISSLYPAYERVLVSCWLCGLVGVGGEDEAVEALTPQIVNLPGVADLLPAIPPADPFAVASSFVKGVASTFASKEVIVALILLLRILNFKPGQPL